MYLRVDCHPPGAAGVRLFETDHDVPTSSRNYSTLEGLGVRRDVEPWQELAQGGDLQYAH